MNLFKKRLKRLVPILAIIGPGIIAGSVDNDAGGITTYSIAGASFGYSLIWILFLTTFSLAVTQEVGVRMGLVTGKGLASLIREKFGIRWTAFIMVVLLLANIGIIAAEFAGIAASFEIFDIPRIISIPIAFSAIYIFVTKGGFKSLERVFLLLSFFYLTYLASAILAHPNWSLAVKSLVVPSFSLNTGFLLAAIAVIGTTITPWGQFFIQDYVVDKKLSKEDLHIERGDVFFGSFLTNIIAFFIIVAAAATLFTKGIPINSAKEAAIALAPLAGNFASILFALGFLNASLFGAALVPLTTAYVVSDAFGFESGLNFSLEDAPQFYGLFTFSLFIGGLLVILPFVPLIPVLFLTQALGAVLLLPVLIFVYILSTDKKLLNSYVNGKIVNITIILTFLAIAASSTVYLISLFLR